MNTEKERMAPRKIQEKNKSLNQTREFISIIVLIEIQITTIYNLFIYLVKRNTKTLKHLEYNMNNSVLSSFAEAKVRGHLSESRRVQIACID